jgi:heat-inducible transcriptional repressor
MLDERKTAILRAIVQEYITTAQPVGSGHVAAAPGVNVSSATVRNEMAVLEQEGYLRQPHTSAGRVPTDKGYRFFVDHLAGPGRLDDDRTQQVRSFFAATHGALEQMLHDTSRLLSRLTNYAAIVVGPGHEATVLRSVQLVPLSSRVVMLVTVTSTGAVDHQPIDVMGLDGGDDVTDARAAAASAHLSAHLVGTSPSVAMEVPLTGDAATDTLCSTAMTALRRLASKGDEHLYVGGTSTVAAAFDAVDVVRNVLSTLEQQYVVVSLLRDVLDRGLTVAIGTEHGVEPLAACSVVVAPYVVEGEALGTVGVLGPTRMNYPQALAAVDIVSERLGRRLSEG